MRTCDVLRVVAVSGAVTSTDYEAIVPTIYPEAESVSVYGGETLVPPRYGKVFISIKPYNGDFVSNILKDEIKTRLRKYTVAGIVPEIIDLKYLYVEYDSTAYYNQNLASGASSVKSTIERNISAYSDSAELNKYGARFKYSKFQKIIDDSDSSVTSNITKIIIRRNLQSKINTLADYEICFGNAFAVLNGERGYNIRSSGFTIDGVEGTVYLGDIPDDLEAAGKVIVFKLTANNETSIVREIGKIDYVKGEIYLFNVNIESAVKVKEGQEIIEISAVPESNDVIGLQDLYLQLSVENSTINMVSDRISSGADLSGSTYIRSSSYFDFDEAVIR